MVTCVFPPQWSDSSYCLCSPPPPTVQATKVSKVSGHGHKEVRRRGRKRRKHIVEEEEEEGEEDRNETITEAGGEETVHSLLKLLMRVGIK